MTTPSHGITRAERGGLRLLQQVLRPQWLGTEAAQRDAAGCSGCRQRDTHRAGRPGRLFRPRLDVVRGWQSRVRACRQQPGLHSWTVLGGGARPAAGGGGCPAGRRLGGDGRHGPPREPGSPWVGLRSLACGGLRLLELHHLGSCPPHGCRSLCAGLLSSRHFMCGRGRRVLRPREVADGYETEA